MNHLDAWRRTIVAALLVAPGIAFAQGGSTERFNIPSIAVTNTGAHISYLGPGAGCVVLARLQAQFTPSGGFDASQVRMKLTTPVLPNFAVWQVTGSDLGWSGTTGTFVANVETHVVDGPFDVGGPGSFSLWEVDVDRDGGGGYSGQFQSSFFEVEIQPGCTFGVPYCAGDGTGTPCPCGNFSLPAHGCANSVGGGALLAAFGSPEVSDDAFALSANGLPPGQPALFFQALNAVNGGAGVAFGDGLRCAGGNIVRLETAAASATGEVSTSTDLIAKGGIAAGQMRRYQAWYRDPQGSPCGTGFNATNAVEILWMP